MKDAHRRWYFIKTKSPFCKNITAEVAGCLKYEGHAKTIDEMNDAIAKGLKAQFHDCTDTNIIVRLLAQDDLSQYKKAYNLLNK